MQSVLMTACLLCNATHLFAGRGREHVAANRLNLHPRTDLSGPRSRKHGTMPSSTS